MSESKVRYVKVTNFPTNLPEFTSGDVARVIREYVEPASEWSGKPEIPMVVAVNEKWPMPLHLQPHQFEECPTPALSAPVEQESTILITDRMQGVDCPYCEDGTAHKHGACSSIGRAVEIGSVMSATDAGSTPATRHLSAPVEAAPQKDTCPDCRDSGEAAGSECTNLMHDRLMHLAAFMYQVAGANLMPLRIMDALSTIQSGGWCDISTCSPYYAEENGKGWTTEQTPAPSVNYLSEVKKPAKPISEAQLWGDAPEKCGVPYLHLIAGHSYFVCGADKGHHGDHRGEGNCTKHGPYLGEPGQAPRCPHWPDCITPAPNVEEPRCQQVIGASPCSHVESHSIHHGESETYRDDQGRRVTRVCHGFIPPKVEESPGCKARGHVWNNYNPEFKTTCAVCGIAKVEDTAVELPPLDKASELLVYRDGMVTDESVRLFRLAAESELEASQARTRELEKRLAEADRLLREIMIHGDNLHKAKIAAYLSQGSKESKS